MSGADPAGLTPLQQAAAIIQKLRGRLDRLEGERREPVAVVGLACRFPGGADPERFWASLAGGVDATREVPPDRWDVDAFYDPDPDAPGKICTRRGGFLDRVDGFDPQLFGLAAREAVSLDPQHRLLLEVAWEALERAGIDPRSLAGSRTAVLVGMGQTDYAHLQLALGVESLDLYAGTGNGLSFAAGRLAHLLGLRGPALAVDTACSSSLVAVHLACQSLRQRECDLALVGGTHLVLSPESSIFLSRARAFAPDGRCKTFDAAADGFVRGEGCGVVVLRRLADARARGDRVQALLVGSAVNHDGPSGGLTVPSQEAQEEVVRQALAAAGLGPDDVDYVEAHGTGTQLGDPIELAALAQAFGGRAPGRPLLVGSVKTNVGHLEAAAGMAGLIKAVLALEHGEIPPHLHFREPNPHVPWSEIPLRVTAEATAWPEVGRARRAGVSSFGMSGTNAHVLVEEAPASVAGEMAERERPAHLLALSARTPEALAELAGRWADHLEGHPELAAGDVAHTALVGRSRLASRLAVVAGDTAEMAAGLRAVEKASGKEGVWTGRAAVEAPAVALLFTGQGSQYRGMGEDLEGEPVFREALDRCSAVLDPVLGVGLREVLWGPDESLLEQTRWAQPALVALEWSLAELWRSWGVEASAVMGHSVGELTAAMVAGVLGVEEGLRFAAERGRRMQEAPGRGGMLAVSAGELEVLDLLGPEVSVAAVNGRRQVVLSGWAEALSEVEQRLRARGVESRRLPVSHGFHSVQMDGMLGGLEAWLGGVELRQPDRWLVSGVTGAPVGEEVRIAGYWRRQAREPVRFAAGIEHLWAAGYRVFLEVGPQPTLVSLGRRTVDAGGSGRWLASLRRGAPGVRTLLSSLGELFVAGLSVDGAGLDRGRRRRRLVLPTYPFQRQRYWIDVPPASARVAGRGERPAGAPEVRDPDRHLYELAWRPAEPQAAPSPGNRLFWIVAGSGPWGEELTRRLARRGHRTRMVDAAAPPPAEPAGERVSAVVHLGGLDASSGLPGAALDRGCGSVLTWIRALGGIDAGALWLVTRGAQAVAGSAVAAAGVAQAPLWGLGRVALQERPELGCRLLDLDPEGEAGLDLLVRDLEAPDGEPQLAYRGGRRYAARLVRLAAPAPRPVRLRADRCYLITGGLGALGQQVAAGLVARGARWLALAQRSAPDTGARAWIAGLEERGARVWCGRADLAAPDGVDGLLADLAAAGWPSVGGVVHAAGVLEDGVLGNQDLARLRRALGAKADGAWRLHAAGLELDFLVLFSSSAALLGSAGQGPYAAANAALDALALHRRGLGLPGVSVAWGAWAGGMAARLGARDQDRLAGLGLGRLAPEPAVELLLERLAGGEAAHLAVLPLDWTVLRRHLPAGEEPPVYREVLAAAAPRAAPAHGTLEDYLRERAAALLGFPPESLQVDEPLGSQGFDSLMSVELRNRILADLRVTLPVAALLQNPTLGQLAAELRALGCRGSGANGSRPAAPAGQSAWSPVVPLRAGGALPPLFLVHPWAGVVFPYFDLARALPADQPVHGLQAAGLYGEPDRSVEAMARRYVEAVLATAPPPYRVGGWSFGAPVAFEMARQLRRHGAAVERVLLLDPPKPDPTVLDWLDFTFTVALLHIWPYLTDYLKIAAAGARDGGEEAALAAGSRRGLRRALGAELASLRSPDAMVRRIVRTVNVNSRAIQRYRPGSYAGPVTIFRMRDQVKGSELDLSAGWSRHAADLDVQVVPGHHLRFLRRPHVSEIAGRLRPYLEGEA